MMFDGSRHGTSILFWASDASVAGPSFSIVLDADCCMNFNVTNFNANEFPHKNTMEITSNSTAVRISIDIERVFKSNCDLRFWED